MSSERHYILLTLAFMIVWPAVTYVEATHLETVWRDPATFLGILPLALVFFSARRVGSAIMPAAIFTSGSALLASVMVYLVMMVGDDGLPDISVPLATATLVVALAATVIVSAVLAFLGSRLGSS